MKKKIVTICLVVALLMIGIVGGSLAYFTDNDTKTNTFTVGNVDIELVESAWVEGSIADPGVPVKKNPTVNNIGDNDAWIRVNVTISDADAFLAAAEAHNIADLSVMFGVIDSQKWTLAGVTEDEQADTITYSYYFNSILPTSASTGALFETVTVPAAFTESEMEAIGNDFTITVTADAIQSSGLNTVTEAFTAFDGQ